jgi:aryl sulfotransferase
VTDTVWLASYPKSGNTWFRMLVANLSATDAPVDINNLPEREGIASGRGRFEYVTLLDSGLLTHEEADGLRPHVYEALAGEGDRDDAAAEPSPGPRLVKVHDAYGSLLGGRRGAQGAIVIVRDPRDIAPSLANHRGTDIDEAIGFLNDDAARFCGGLKAQADQLRQILLDWSSHLASWLDQTELPVHLLRYEDLVAQPVEAFKAAMAFAGRPVSRADAERAADFARFDRLQAQERTSGFAEWRRGGRAGHLFFRRGESNGWRCDLTQDQVRRIESAHRPMMARLGYETAICQDRAAVGIGAGEPG